MANLKIAVLDVGHGDFIYAETPKGETLVIDCGPGDGPVSPSSFLSKVARIDELQISHPHTDHFGDIESLQGKDIRSFRCASLEKFSDKVIGWRNADAKKIQVLRSMQERLAANNGAVLEREGFSHQVYYPTNVDYEDPNTVSSVTVLSYNDFKMLLGADLPAEGWENLLGQPGFVAAIKGTKILKVPHHGREVGCSDALFDVISPALCIISDKPIDKSNENTVCVDWYSKRSTGLKWPDGIRKVLTTRSDGSVHIQATGSGYHVWKGVTWKDDYTGA